MADKMQKRGAILPRIVAMMTGRPKAHGMPRWAVVHARQAAEAQRAEGQVAR